MAADAAKPAGGSGEHHDVVVVGAGVSGLATAWHLRDRDVLVLEEADRVGGRIRSVRREDTWLNFGAHVYGGDGTATDRLLRGLGVTALPLPGQLAALAYAGRIVTSPVETYPFRLPLPVRSRAALVRAGLKLRYDVARYDRMIRPRSGESPAERQARVVTFMDDESFSDRIGALPPDVDAMFRCTLTRSSGEPEELAAGYGVGYFHLVWDRSSGLSRGIIGGPSTMIERLASMVPEVRTGARVTLVEESARRRPGRGGGRRRNAEIDGRRRRARRAGAGRRRSGAGPARRDGGGAPRGALRAVRRRRLPRRGQGALPWDGLYAVATPGRSFGMAYNIGNVQQQPGAPRPAHGTVMVYAAADLGARLLLEDDETIARRFRDDLCAVFPEVTRRIGDIVIQRWPRGIPFAHVGRGRLQAALTRPLGRLHLVGDYLGTRYVETCAENAEAAALRSAKQLPPRG